jgi:hypothetical protein
MGFHIFRLLQQHFATTLTLEDTAHLMRGRGSQKGGTASQAKLLKSVP